MDAAKSFSEQLPRIAFLTPDSPDYVTRRETRGEAGQECTPIGIAVPKNAQETSEIVRWATAARVDITVRTRGNDFYGRNVVDGGLIIDTRDINFISVSDDKTTVTIGGGVITKDLVCALEKEGLLVPTGNTWIVGYVGWATLGGYGPLTNSLGMGFEAILGAEVVNASGDIVEADEEMLEGIRGLGGNLGIITALTIKAYPARKLLSGFLLLEATADNVRDVIAAEAKLDIPPCLTLHHFIMVMGDRRLVIFFTWSDPDLNKGQDYLESFVAAMPPLVANRVEPKTFVKHHEDLPLGKARWGGQRSCYVREMSPAIVDLLMEALQTMPGALNVSWSHTVDVNHSTAPKNCFGAGPHRLLTFSDMVPEEHMLAAARAWSDTLYDNLRACGDSALMDGSYPPLTRPESRTTEQLLGDKWPRARELKAKFDANNVFKFAVPRM